MNIYQERFDRQLLGNYRAQIVEINSKNKNGIYKVKIYPYMADIENQYLPWAFSNLTVEGQHVSLKVEEWVWVFFENGDAEYPIIFDRCNIKDQYPQSAKGSDNSYKPDYYPDDADILTYAGTYNSVDGFDFGDNIHVEFDEAANSANFIIKGGTFTVLIANDDYTGYSKLEMFSDGKIRIKSRGTQNISIESDTTVMVSAPQVNIGDEPIGKVVLCDPTTPDTKQFLTKDGSVLFPSKTTRA